MTVGLGVGTETFGNHLLEERTSFAPATRHFAGHDGGAISASVGIDAVVLHALHESQSQLPLLSGPTSGQARIVRDGIRGAIRLSLRDEFKSKSPLASRDATSNRGVVRNDVGL